MQVSSQLRERRGASRPVSFQLSLMVGTGGLAPLATFCQPVNGEPSLVNAIETQRPRGTQRSEEERAGLLVGYCFASPMLLCVLRDLRVSNSSSSSASEWTAIIESATLPNLTRLFSCVPSGP